MRLPCFSAPPSPAGDACGADFVSAPKRLADRNGVSAGHAIRGLACAAMTWMTTEFKRTIPDSDEGDRSASVLLVEADDGLRRLLFWRLYLEGLTVLTARDPQEALRVSRDLPGPIELLIIGSLPPGGDRLGLHREIVADRPDVRAILLHVPEAVSATGTHGREGVMGVPPMLDPLNIVDDVLSVLRRRRR